MSTNIKFLNQQENATSKNFHQKKLNLNGKIIPINSTKSIKSFRGKLEKNKNQKQTLGVINENENDINHGNVK